MYNFLGVPIRSLYIQVNKNILYEKVGGIQDLKAIVV